MRKWNGMEPLNVQSTAGAREEDTTAGLQKRTFSDIFQHPLGRCACSDCSAGNCQKVRCNIPRNKPLFPLILIIICPFSTLATILQPHIMVQICLHTYLIWTAPFAPAFPLRALSHSYPVGQLTRKLFQPFNDTHQAGVRLFEWEGFKAVRVPVDICIYKDK